MGIVARRVSPAEIGAAIADLVSREKPDKFRQRPIPEKMQVLARTCSDENVERMLNGLAPEGVDETLAARTAKGIGFKAPVALRLANEIIDAQTGLSMADAAEVELSRLSEIFATEDALEGLSTMGRKKPAYKGR